MANWQQQYGRAQQNAPVQAQQGQGYRTDLYFPSLPLNWDQEEIKAFHHDCGAEAGDIVNVKLLQPKRPGVNSRAAIVRYLSFAAAAKAMKLIQGSGNQLEVRFADEKEKGTGKGASGKSYQDGGVAVRVGLRVRNSGNGQTGRVVACRGRTPGTFRVLFDNGQEWEWEVKRFESEEGWPLVDSEMIPATVGMRVRCWMDGRCGRIAYIHNDWTQRVWVAFDDGEEGERDATWFVSENGCEPVGPGLKPTDWSQNSASNSKGSGKWDSWPAGKGSSGKATQQRQQDKWWESDYRKQDWQDQRPPMRPRGQENWKDAKDQGKGRGNQQEERRYAKGSGKESRKPEYSTDYNKNKIYKPKGETSAADAELEEQALREVIDQLLDENNHGRVWITNWPGRYQSKFGQLRDFLESHSDKFVVMTERGRRYTVAFAGKAPPAKAHGKSKQSTGPKWKARSDGDAAGGSAAAAAAPATEGSAATGPRSAIRRADDDSTAFDAPEDNEDSDETPEEGQKAEEGSD